MEELPSDEDIVDEDEDQEGGEDEQEEFSHDRDLH
jgi:hypothetical protein